MRNVVLFVIVIVAVAGALAFPPLGSHLLPITHARMLAKRIAAFAGGNS